MSHPAPVNSREAIDARRAEGRIPRLAPFAVVFARPVLALLAQVLTTLLFVRLEVQDAPVAVRHWWTVYGTLVDLGCVVILLGLTRHEGVRLLDLVSFDRSKLRTDVLIGLGIVLVVFPLTVIGGAMVASRVAYGALNPVFPEAGFIRTLPFWAVVYSRLIWWPLWSFTEELVYQGYSLPRLQIISRSTWCPVALVALGWSLQHSFLPWIDPRHGLYLFLAFVPLTIALQVVYLRVRRLTPLVIGHGLMDLSSVLLLLRVG